MTRSLTIAGTENSDTGIDLAKLLMALQPFKTKPWLRVCMYKNTNPLNYLHILMTLKQSGYSILLQPCDSQDLHSYSLSKYESLFENVMSNLYPHFDMIEVANEINGDWTGQSPQFMMAVALKATAGTVPRAVTLYLDNADQDELWSWIQRNPFYSEYVFLSNYPYSSDASPLDPSRALLQLAGRFPHSKVGIGEYGTENPNGDEGSDLRKINLIRAFESRQLLTPQDEGFGFYWDFYNDVVKGKSPIVGGQLRQSWA